MFINFWYAAEVGANLGAKPLPVKMLGQNLVLYRDAGKVARCVAAACIHRGGALCDGQVIGDEIECPYHGWRYGLDGRCTRIPSAPASSNIPPRARIDAYPVQEKYGLIFVFLGDLPEADRPSLMEIPEWGDPGYRFTMRDRVVRANQLRAMENGVDMTHGEFVHSDMMGMRGADRDGDEYVAPTYDIKDTQWGAGIHCHFPPGPGWGKFWNRVLGFEKNFTGTEVSQNYWGANALATSIWISKARNLHLPQYIWETPVDEYSYRAFFVGGRSFLKGRWYDALNDRRMNKVSNQDNAIIEKLDPILPAESRSVEFLVEPDRIISRFHASLDNWQARGWRIDSRKLAAYRPGEKVFAIPSPARRTSGSWVHDPVPLIPAEPHRSGGATLLSAGGT
jgi:phenylpropionate dioxygenase-like ring-hydroxylating dioxygenase large terminal subunit